MKNETTEIMWNELKRFLVLFSPCFIIVWFMSEWRLMEVVFLSASLAGLLAWARRFVHPFVEWLKIKWFKIKNDETVRPRIYFVIGLILAYFGIAVVLIIIMS